MYLSVLTNTREPRASHPFLRVSATDGSCFYYTLMPPFFKPNSKKTVKFFTYLHSMVYTINNDRMSAAIRLLLIHADSCRSARAAIDTIFAALTKRM